MRGRDSDGPIALVVALYLSSCPKNINKFAYSFSPPTGRYGMRTAHKYLHFGNDPAQLGCSRWSKDMPELMVSQKISLRNLGDLGVSAVKNSLHLSHRRGTEDTEMTQRRSDSTLFLVEFSFTRSTMRPTDKGR